jgi:hypothetical protein
MGLKGASLRGGARRGKVGFALSEVFKPRSRRALDAERVSCQTVASPLTRSYEVANANWGSRACDREATQRSVRRRNVR